jgi:hypothetical protein
VLLTRDLPFFFLSSSPHLPLRLQGLGSFIRHLNITGSQPSMLDLLSSLSDASGVVL